MTIIRGDSATWRIPIFDEDNQPYNLTGATVTVTYKARVSDPDSAALFRHWIAIDGSGSVTSARGMALETTVAAGVIIETLTPAESDAFYPMKYHWDLEVRKGGEVRTVLADQEEQVVADIGRTSPI